MAVLCCSSMTASCHVVKCCGAVRAVSTKRVVSGAYTGELRTVGLDLPAATVEDFLIDPDGSFSATVGGCVFEGTLERHGETGVYETEIAIAGDTCSSKAHLTGIVTPLSIEEGRPLLAFQTNAEDGDQTAVFLVQKLPLNDAGVTDAGTEGSITNDAATDAAVPIPPLNDAGFTDAGTEGAITNDAATDAAAPELPVNDAGSTDANTNGSITNDAATDAAVPELPLNDAGFTDAARL